MTKSYTRGELYELVWSEPMTSLASKISISTTTIRKGCHGLQVPIPPQGHWLRKAHNKPLQILPLPKRGPGVADHIEFGVDPFRHYYWHQFSEAELMGVDFHRDLTRIGLLPSSPEGISIAAIRDFQARYVKGSELARSLGTSSRGLANRLAAKGIKPVTGPGVDGGRQTFFVREEATVDST